MSFKSFFQDLWLTIKHGKWHAVKKGKYWYAECRRERRCHLCIDRREAQAYVAMENDLRGTGI